MWQNWAGNVAASGFDVLAPATTEEVAEAVALAARTGRKVKAIGAGHSFSAIGQPVDLQLQLHRLTGIVSHDVHTQRVRVRAGTRLREMNPALWDLGLAMPNLGDFDGQTVSGAIATGTHGTGDALTGLAGFVRAIEMVLADGSVVRYDDAHQPDRVAAAAVGLGALGIVTEYELQCVPAFLLRAHESPDRLDAVLERLPEIVEGQDHFEFFYFPHTDRVQTKTNVRLEATEQANPLPRWRATLDDKILANSAFEGINRVTSRAPTLIPRVNQLTARVLTERTYTDRSYSVLTTERTVRFRESELSMPRDQVAGALRTLRDYFHRGDQRVTFPVEVRFTAADDRWLSTSYGRPSAYVAIHQYHRLSEQPYFGDVWKMLMGPEVRPHWGKMHDLRAADLRARYERFDDFVELRDRLDPDRVFGNSHLEQVLGG